MHLSINLSRAESVCGGVHVPVQPKCVHSVGLEGRDEACRAREGEIPSVGVDLNNNVGTYQRLISSCFHS